MIKIEKNTQPNSLLIYKKSGGDYNSIPRETKSKLRESLIEEQGYVCCYCLKRIPENKLGLNHTKIEHFKSQTKYPDLDLEYSNLHLACKGNQGNSRINQTCDTAKSDKDIFHFSLTDNSLKGDILYARDGTVLSRNDEIDREINDVLQLNNDQNLKNARKKVRDGLSNSIKRLNKKGKLSEAILKQKLENWKCKNNRKHKEHFPVAVQYLEKKIKRFNSC